MNNHFVGKSAFAKEMNSLVDKVSLLDVCVLLIGETGVGKKHFAKSVHKHLYGNERDFFIINCKNLTENSLENLQGNISKLENSNTNKKVVTAADLLHVVLSFLIKHWICLSCFSFANSLRL